MTFVATIASTSATERSATDALPSGPRKMPALFTRPRSAPHARTASNIAHTSGSWETSASNAAAWPPDARMDATSASASGLDDARWLIATAHPCDARSVAHAAPMPFAAPVMRTTSRSVVAGGAAAAAAAAATRDGRDGVRVWTRPPTWRLETGWAAARRRTPRASARRGSVWTAGRARATAAVVGIPSVVAIVSCPAGLLHAVARARVVLRASAPTRHPCALSSFGVPDD